MLFQNQCSLPKSFLRWVAVTAIYYSLCELFMRWPSMSIFYMNSQFLPKDTSDWFKTREQIIQGRKKTYPSYSSNLHSFITDRAWPFLSVTGEKRTKRERWRKERKKQMERYWDRNRMFMYVCGHMYPSVFSLNAKKKKKKTGTMDMTPSAKRSGLKKTPQKTEMMYQRRKRTKE